MTACTSSSSTPPARDRRRSSPSSSAGELGRALGLPVPEIVLVELDAALGKAEPDPEIQDLLVRSAGLDLGLDFLPGALPFDPAAGERPGADAPDPDLAADVVWFDAFITNVDRTAKNVNLLVWHRRLWLIDHGAALYIHHTWRDPAAHARRPFERIADHVLLPYAGSIVEADDRLAPRVDDGPPPVDRRGDPGRLAGRRSRQTSGGPTSTTYWRRLAAPRAFVEEAERARTAS